MNLDISLADAERIAKLAFHAANNYDNHRERHKHRDTARRFAKAIAKHKAGQWKANL